MVRSLCISCIFAAAAGNICVNDADYNADADMTTLEGEELKCSAYVTEAGLGDFAGTKEACFTMKDDGEGGQYAMSALLSQMSACCGSGMQVCDQFSVNPCVTESDFNPAATVDGDACAAVRSMIPAFDDAEPSAEACAASVSMGEETMAKVAVMTWMAPCCGGKATKCASHIFNPCKTPGNFNAEADSKMDDDEPLPCGMAAPYMPPFTASKATCEETVQIADMSDPRHVFVGKMAANCCGGDDVGVCAEFMATTTENNSSGSSSSAVAMHAAAGAALAVAAVTMA